MANATYKKVPLGPPSPAKPAFDEDDGEELEELKKAPTAGYVPTKQELEEDPLERLQKTDAELKRRIRVLKVISRLTAACLSLAVMVPLAITLHKFLTTRNQYRVVTNESGGGGPVRRTAWALQSNTWPTYMYFSIAVLSFTFNLTIMASYLHSIRTANRAATVGTIFSTAVLLLNFVICAVTTALYKQQAVATTNGKHDDLWGWTCSPAAKLLQPVFRDQINFNRYCGVQSVSWYLGLVQVGATLLTLVLYLLAIRRLQSKKAIRRSITARQMMS